MTREERQRIMKESLKEGKEKHKLEATKRRGGGWEGGGREDQPRKWRKGGQNDH